MDAEEIEIAIRKHPICAICNRFMKLVEDHVLVRIGASHYFADIYQCPACDARVYARFGDLLPEKVIKNAEIDAEIELD